MLLWSSERGYSSLIADFPTDRNGTLWKKQLKGSILVSPDWTTCSKADSPKAHAFYSRAGLDAGRPSVAGNISTKARHDTANQASTSRQRSLRLSFGPTCC